MNPLLQVTKSGILERQVLKEDAFPDKYILDAIDAYDKQKTPKAKAIAFNDGLTPLWEQFGKGEYSRLFKKYIDFERNQEIISIDYISHINHVMQEFLFGYNILINCEFIRAKYEYASNRNKKNSSFGELFFTWMAASLLHDVGYDIENSAREEVFREQKNDFWHFLTPRPINEDCITLVREGELLVELLRRYFNEVFNQTYSPEEFIELFKIAGNGTFVFDHAFISAIKYWSELEFLQKSTQGNYFDWIPNKNAALAMLLHNFRYKNKKADISITANDDETLISYLLIICDEIQEWEREREDIDSVIPVRERSGKKERLYVSLEGLVFRENHAFITLNHKLVKDGNINRFIRFFTARISSLKLAYPIETEPMEIFESKVSKIAGDRAKTTTTEKRDTELKRPLDRKRRPKINIKPGVKLLIEKAILKIPINQDFYNLLKQSTPPVYTIIVEHRIEGDPYLNVKFFL